MAANSSLAAPALAPADGCLFAGFLLLAPASALFFGLRGHRTPTHYFLAGRHMRPVCVGVSAGLTALPAAAFSTLPDAAFAAGFGAALAPLSGAFAFFLVSAFVIESLRPLKLDSLGAFFSARLRSRHFVLFADLLALLCVLPAAAYQLCQPLGVFLAWINDFLTAGPALVLFSLPIVLSAALGGFRGVVWSQASMAAVLLAAAVAILFQSVLNTPGGMATILRLNAFQIADGGFDLRSDHSLLAVTAAAFVGWGLAAAQPANVQRLASTATRREAYLVATTASGTLFAFTALSTWVGLNIFGFFADRGCDVLLTLTGSPVVVAYAQHSLAHPGYRGLVLAAIFVGPTSSLLAGVNAAAAVIWKDVLGPRYFRHAAHRSAVLLSKLLSLACGLLAVPAAYLLFLLAPSVRRLALIYTAGLWAPYLGMFLLVAVFPKAQPVGVAVGTVTTSVLTFCLGLAASDCPERPAPRLADCHVNSSNLLPLSGGNETAGEVPDWLSCISPVWLPPFGLVLTLLLAFAASLPCCCYRGRARQRTSSRVGVEGGQKAPRDADCLYVSLNTIER